MLPTLIQSLVLASAGLLSVGSITIIILLLMSDQGVRNGVGYALGYFGVYTLIGIAVILAGDAMADGGSGENGRLFPIFLLCMSALLLWLSYRNWRKPPSQTSENPRLFSIIDNITPPKAFAFGAVVTVFNFKNLALYLTAVSVPLVSDLPLPTKLIIVVPIALVFCTSVITPVLVYIILPRRADHFLGWIKQAIATHSRQIGIWLPLIFGFIFLLKGLLGL